MAACPRAAVRRSRVLIVDDDIRVVIALTHVLERVGMPVTYAGLTGRARLYYGAAMAEQSSRVGRYVKMTARQGQGDVLAERMLRVAEGLAGVDGCELYIINRAPADPDVVWVTEVWSGRDAIDASLAHEGASEAIQEVLTLLAGRPELIETLPLGGPGLPA